MANERIVGSRLDQVAAQARLREYAKLKSSPNDKFTTMSRSVIAQIGQFNWRRTYYGVSPSDDDATARWINYIDSLRFTDVEQHFLLSQQLLLMDATILNFGSARWFGEGLPCFRLGHKQAAALMSTTVSADMAEHIKPPFRAFYIELPNGLLELTGTDGEIYPAVGVLVQVIVTDQEHETIHGTKLPAGSYWRWLCTTRSPTLLWEMNRRLDELIAGTVLPDDDYYGIGVELDDHDHRVRRLVKRLITSLCLELTSGKELKRKVEPWAREGKKAKGGPSFNVFIDPTELEVDLRPYIKAFLSGERKSPDYQHWVEGHWKNQPYGPRLSLRKPIHILPYKRLEHLPERPS
jgi:hypothetical protein